MSERQKELLVTPESIGKHCDRQCLSDRASLRGVCGAVFIAG